MVWDWRSPPELPSCWMLSLAYWFWIAWLASLSSAEMSTSFKLSATLAWAASSETLCLRGRAGGWRSSIWVWVAANYGFAGVSENSLTVSFWTNLVFMGLDFFPPGPFLALEVLTRAEGPRALTPGISGLISEDFLGILKLETEAVAAGWSGVYSGTYCYFSSSSGNLTFPESLISLCVAIIFCGEGGADWTMISGAARTLAWLGLRSSAELS